MGKMAHGVMGKTMKMGASFIGSGAPGGVAPLKTRTFFGTTSAHPISNRVGLQGSVVMAKPNHGGKQRATSSGVTYKGVSTDYC